MPERKKTIMAKKRKIKSPFKEQQKKYSRRDIVALVLALVAVSSFILNSIYFLTEKETILALSVNPQYPEIFDVINALSVILPIVWIIFSILMSIIIYQIEHNKLKWHSLFWFSIISLFTFRIDSFILGLISSFLYKKNHK